MTIETGMRWGLVAGIGCFCLHVRAASFDCKLAKTPQEKAICGSPALSAADERLAAVYKAQLAAVPAVMQGTFREGQRQFLQALALGCAADKPQPLATLAACMQPQVEARIAALKGSVSRRGGTVFVTEAVTLLGKDTNSYHAVEGQESNPGFGTVTASWPQAVASGPQWAAWNAAITRETQRMADPEGDKDNPTGWVDGWASDQEATVAASVEQVHGDLVSSLISDEFMGHGAAHPGESYERFHWLLRKGRELAVSDVFAEGAAWKPFVTRKCRAGLHAQAINGQDITYDDQEMSRGLAETIATTHNWSFSRRGLTINFPEYAVAPRVSQPEPVTISWMDLKPYLSPGFTPPQ